MVFGRGSHSGWTTWLGTSYLKPCPFFLGKTPVTYWGCNSDGNSLTHKPKPLSVHFFVLINASPVFALFLWRMRGRSIVCEALSYTAWFQVYGWLPVREEYCEISLAVRRLSNQSGFCLLVGAAQPTNCNYWLAGYPFSLT